MADGWKRLIANRLQAAAAASLIILGLLSLPVISGLAGLKILSRVYGGGFQPDQPFGRGLFLYRRDVWGGGFSHCGGRRPSGALRSLYPRAYYGFVFVVFTVVSKAVLFVLERRGSKETQEGALFKMQDTAEKKDHQEDKASSSPLTKAGKFRNVVNVVEKIAPHRHDEENFLKAMHSDARLIQPAMTLELADSLDAALSKRPYNHSGNGYRRFSVGEVIGRVEENWRTRIRTLPSGGAQEALKVFEAARGQGNRIMAITGPASSPLAKPLPLCGGLAGGEQ